MKQKKLSKLINFILTSSALSAMGILNFASASLAGYPAAAWRGRDTELYNVDNCVSVAYDVMYWTGLSNVQESDTMGVTAANNDVRAYIICEDNGSRAMMFCAGDGSSYICDELANYMDDAGYYFYD